LTVRHDINYSEVITARRHLGEFEQVLLYALLRLGDGAPSSAIREAVHERTGRALSPGAVYTGLDRLQRRGFVTSELGEPTPERGGKRRRRYSLRPAGRSALREMHAALEQLARGLKPTLVR
jgi:DNA-binding PadR family transcriptional regulator